MKVYILLVLIGAIYCQSKDITDEAADEVWFPYEFLGNGVRNPETSDQVRDHCDRLGTVLNPVSVLFKDLTIAAGYILTRMTGFGRSIIMPTGEFLHNDALGSYCSLPHDQLLKYNEIVNKHLQESKPLRDRFMGYLEEILNTGKVDWAQLVCMASSFFRDVINLHGDDDGFKDYAKTRLSFFAEHYMRIAEEWEVESQVKDACVAYKANYPQPKYKSFTMQLIKIIHTHGKLIANPARILKRGLSPDPRRWWDAAFMIPTPLDLLAKIPLPGGMSGGLASAIGSFGGIGIPGMSVASQGFGMFSKMIPGMDSAKNMFSGLAGSSTKTSTSDSSSSKDYLSSLTNSRDSSNNRDRYGSNDRDRYGSNDRDRYSSSDRDRYSSSDRDRYGSNDRDRYGSNDRDRYGSNDRDRYGSSDRNRYDSTSKDTRYESTSRRNNQDSSSNRDQQEWMQSKQYQDWLASKNQGNQDSYNQNNQNNQNKRDALSKDSYESWSNKPTYDPNTGITRVESFKRETHVETVNNQGYGSSASNYGGQQSRFPSGSPPAGSNYGAPSGGYNPSSQSGGYNPSSQSGGYNPSSQSQSGGYNPSAQSGGYNPSAQPSNTNYGAPSGGNSPNSPPGGYNSSPFPASPMSPPLPNN